MSTLTDIRRLLTTGVLGLAAITALTISVGAQIPPINACVNQNSGEIKITGAGGCAAGSVLLQLNQAGPAGPAGAPGPPGIANVYYLTAGMYPNTSVSRAFCPAGTKVTAGGGVSLSGVGLQQSFPISDESGVIAFGSTAIGWQVAASDFSDVQAFVVCVGP